MTTSTNPAARRIDSGAAALWASAFVLVALIITQASTLGRGNQARADVAVTTELTVLSAFAGNDEDIVAVIDRQSEMLFVYGIEQGRNIELFQAISLPHLFADGARSGGAAAPTTR